MKEIAGEDFHITHTPQHTNVHFKNPDHRKLYMQKMNKHKVEYFTYTPKEERTYGHVVKGLEMDITPEELKHELNRKNVETTNIYKMNTMSRTLYLVITKKEVSTEQLQKKVNYLCYTKVTWEKHVNKKLFIQCRRCQAWGHAQSNCNINPKCVICAGDHLTPTFNNKDKVKCVNCGGA